MNQKHVPLCHKCAHREKAKASNPDWNSYIKWLGDCYEVVGCKIGGKIDKNDHWKVTCPLIHKHEQDLERSLDI